MAALPVIGVWAVALDAPGAGGPDDWNLLDDGERTRARRYVFSRDRRRFVARRAVLRRLLARQSGCDARAISYLFGRFGRLRAAGIAHDFSLSHSEERALIAIGAVARLGVDIERVDPSRAERGMLARHVEPGLAIRLEAALEAGDAEPFFRWWTVVEAMAKARGTGIVEEVPVHARMDWLSGAVELPDDESVRRRWTLHCWSPEAGMTAALACSEPVALQLHRHGVSADAATVCPAASVLPIGSHDVV